METLDHYFADPSFWVYMAFFVFLLIAIIKGSKTVKIMLDSKISEIVREMENSQGLREEALGVLADAKYKEQLADTRIRDIVQETEEKIRNIEDEAKQALNRALALQRKRMDEKIMRLEVDTQYFIKNQIIKCSMEVSEHILRDDFHGEEDKVYVRRLIDNFPEVYNKYNVQ